MRSSGGGVVFPAEIASCTLRLTVLPFRAPATGQAAPNESAATADAPDCPRRLNVPGETHRIRIGVSHGTYRVR
jgi:hypothetical protein